VKRIEEEQSTALKILDIAGDEGSTGTPARSPSAGSATPTCSHPLSAELAARTPTVLSKRRGHPISLPSTDLHPVRPPAHASPSARMATAPRGAGRARSPHSPRAGNPEVVLAKETERAL
jgi:hypothetical protein